MTTLSFFITGTDTEIGKTLVSSAMIYALSQKKKCVAGMKPIAAGAHLYQGEWQNEDTHALMRVSNVSLPTELVTPFLLKKAIAPHIAAHLERVEIDFAHILNCYKKITQESDAVIVEGLGGFYVPLSNSLDSTQLAVQFNLPVVLVVGLRLGCINHALLTVEAITSRGLKLGGWVANCMGSMMPYCAENIAALEERLPAPLLGTIPCMVEASAMEAAKYLDFSALPGWPN